MARPRNEVLIDRSVEEADKIIKMNLVKLTKKAVDAALEGDHAVTCPNCHKSFTIKRAGDATLALHLIERIAGKPTDRRDPGPQGAIIDLIAKLSEAGDGEEARDAPGTQPRTEDSAALP